MRVSESAIQAIDVVGRERRAREYKNDSFIRGCINQITKIAMIAKPRIEIALSGNIEDSVFDIDEESKKRIAWWEEQIGDYIKNNYSDIFR